LSQSQAVLPGFICGWLIVSALCLHASRPETVTPVIDSQAYKSQRSFSQFRERKVDDKDKDDKDKDKGAADAGSGTAGSTRSTIGGAVAGCASPNAETQS
jgi:hypothetical protein